MSRPSTGDLIAGVSVALVAIPQSLAYAELAGLPAHYGLYATALPSLLAAFFVSSRYLQTGPVALTALLTLGALSGVAEPGGASYIQSAALLALLVGIIRVLLGVARMGRVAYVLSEPVVTGFTAGAAVVIIASQLPKIFDVYPDGQVLAVAVRALGRPDEWRLVGHRLRRDNGGPDDRGSSRPPPVPRCAGGRHRRCGSRRRQRL